MLGNGHQALIEQVFETQVVHLDHERAAPKITLPMVDCLDQPIEDVYLGYLIKMT
jgi:hypothetical protein